MVFVSSKLHQLGELDFRDPGFGNGTRQGLRTLRGALRLSVAPGSWRQNLTKAQQQP